MNILITRLVFAVGAMALFAASAAADTRVTTVESRVEAVPSSGGATVYRIYGPSNVEYRVEAPPTEIERLSTIVRSSPQATVHFNGQVIERDGVKVFHVENWKTVESSSTKKTVDSFGNERVETETHTQTQTR